MKYKLGRKLDISSAWQDPFGNGCLKQIYYEAAREAYWYMGKAITKCYARQLKSGLDLT